MDKYTIEQYILAVASYLSRTMVDDKGSTWSTPQHWVDDISDTGTELMEMCMSDGLSSQLAAYQWIDCISIADSQVSGCFKGY